MCVRLCVMLVEHSCTQGQAGQQQIADAKELMMEQSRILDAAKQLDSPPTTLHILKLSDLIRLTLPSLENHSLRPLRTASMNFFFVFSRGAEIPIAGHEMK